MSRRNGGIIGPTNTPVGGLFKGVAGGVWRMNDVLTFVSNNQWPSGPKSIENSCRFDDGSSDYLIRTPSSASNSDLWTLSFWVKRCTLGTYQSIYGVYADSNNQETLAFDDSDRLYWQLYQSGGVVGQLTTNRKFRDTSAWYNIVAVYDSANSTAGNRMRLYINSVEETSFATDTNPSSGLDSLWNSTTAHSIGRINTTNYIDMYLAEFVHIDGQALDPTSFGETDSTTGIWKPKKIGAFASAGDNSFYLDFKDSSNLGNDASGLNNDFTVNNLTSIDQSTDTCVENFCTWNPLYIRQTIKPAYSEGNLDVLHDDSSFNEGAIGTISSDSGKWYAEFKVEAVGGNCNLGIIDIDNTTATDTLNVGFIYKSNGNKRVSGSDSSYGDSYTTNDIIGMAMDLDNSKVYFSKNGTFQNSGDPTSGSTGTGAISITAGKFYTWFSSNYQNGSIVMNAGSPSFAISSGNSDANGFGNFEYAVPSGYYALNTSNLNTYG
jgi:hypothetical protein